MAAFDVGDMIRYSCSFTDAAGAAADPTVVSFKLRRAGETEAIYSDVTTPAIARDSTGHFHIDITLTLAGRFYYRWAGTGAVVAASEGHFVVAASSF